LSAAQAGPARNVAARATAAAVDERRWNMTVNLSGTWIGAGWLPNCRDHGVNLESVRRVVERRPRAAGPRSPTHSSEKRPIVKKILLATAILFSTAAAFAQAGTAIKETGKATAETAKQAKENVEAAATKQPKKTMHKAKAKVHKASAAHHRAAAKAAAKEVGK